MYKDEDPEFPPGETPWPWVVEFNDPYTLEKNAEVFNEWQQAIDFVNGKDVEVHPSHPLLDQREQLNINEWFTREGES